MLDQGSGPVDVLTGDYLAELTMLILWKARQKDPGLGYATTFLRQMEKCSAPAWSAASRSSPTRAASTPRVSPRRSRSSPAGSA
jgi:Protein of unknown function (DUF1446).